MLVRFVTRGTSWREAPAAFNLSRLCKGKYLKYCYSIFKELQRVKSTLYYKEILTPFCTPFFKNILNFFQKSKSEEINPYYKEISTPFCTPLFKNFFKFFSKEQSREKINSYYKEISAPFCTPLFKKFFKIFSCGTNRLTDRVNSNALNSRNLPHG